MKYAILITAHPLYAGAYTAYEFVRTALLKGHTIENIFFFKEGVLTGSASAAPPQDEQSIYSRWQQLASEYKLTLTCCVTSAQRRGLVESTIADQFELAGLGQFMACVQSVDRFIQFHN